MYSDFRLIKEDSWSKTRPKIKTEICTTLEILGFVSIKQKRNFIVRCNRCALDKELFPAGVFVLQKYRIMKGEKLCGCAKRKVFTRKQNEILIKRYCKKKDYELISIPTDYSGVQTKVTLNCKKHGQWQNKIYKILTCGYGCPKCGHIKPADPEKEEKILCEIKKKLPNLYDFKKSERVKLGGGGRCYWNFKCRICSDDEFITSGISRNVFESHVSNLKSGRVPCRCSVNYKWNRAEYEFIIKSKIEKETLPYRFICLLDEKNNRQIKFRYECEIHGENLASIDNFLRGRTRCPDCTKMLRKVCQPKTEAYINLIQDSQNVKYGISYDSTARIHGQNMRNNLQMSTLYVYSFFSESLCRSAETECKQTLFSKVVMKELLIDGYTETTHKENIMKITEIYEKYGGVLKSTPFEII